MLCLALLFVLASPPASAHAAQGPGVLKETRPQAEDLARLKKEFADGEEAFYKKLEGLKGEESESAYSEWSKQKEQLFRRAVEIADGTQERDVACDALVWVTTSLGPSELSKTCFERLIAEHTGNARLAEIPSAYVYADKPYAASWMQRLAEPDQHVNTRGQALYSLAQLRLRALSTIKRLRGDEQFKKLVAPSLDKEWVAALEALDPDAVAREAEQLLERVQKEYADVKARRGTLGELAAAGLFELRHLAIGKLAPEIEGADVEGSAFKLGDYRGKVVVIDFWGNW